MKSLYSSEKNKKNKTQNLNINDTKRIDQPNNDEHVYEGSLIL